MALAVAIDVTLPLGDLKFLAFFSEASADALLGEDASILLRHS